MKNRNLLAESVRRALWLGVAGTSMLGATAFAQDDAKGAKTLESVQVTGSRIARTQSESASPIYRIDKAAIEKTGALTIGDFLQDIPSISGAALNPSVNNGGGQGNATISLRGLGDERTLILINGRRIVTNDVNSIPMSMVQTVEVLKDGASATYGSDAVGGVVNFILSKDYDGFQARVDYGISDRSDGQRQGASFTWGTSGDRGNLILTADYNKQEEVRASDRAFSFYALSLGSTSSTGVVRGGSSRAITGRYYLNAGVDALGNLLPANAALVASYGCTNVTLNPANPGAATGDFRCFSFGRDQFNYQAVGNLELTPSERTGLFVSGNYDITDNVTGYIDAFVNKTRSAAQIAPLPFDGLADGVSLSAFNQYNPWDVEIQDIRLRLSRLGNRRYEFTTDVNQFNAGLKGAFADSSWAWDYNVSYGNIKQANDNQGYIDYNALALGLGPSTGGRCYTDGTFTTVIPGCTPIDFVGNFNPGTPAGAAQLAALQAITVNVLNKSTETYKGFQANFNGDLFEMSAGMVKAAVGIEYRKNSFNFDPYDGAIPDPTAGYTCDISQELCTAPTSGNVTVKEVYGEAFIPLASNFSASLGSRWSSYSTFGTTFNSKLGLEWRPSEQLLVRGTYAQVFRAPTIRDLFAGAASASDGFTDPCNGIVQLTNPALPFNAVTNPYVNSTNPACANVLADGAFRQTDTQLSAVKGGVSTLQPEEGTTATIGFVYEPSWLEGFSTTVDFWQAKLDNSIGTIGTQNILNVCFGSSAASPSPLCSLFSRRSSGEISLLFDLRANVGKLSTDGVDIGLRYKLDTGIGQFKFNVDTTYTNKYDVDVIFNGTVVQSQENAGTFLSSANGGNGNYSKWRSLANISWSNGIWDASWNMRYVHGFTVGSEKLSGTCANTLGHDGTEIAADRFIDVYGDGSVIVQDWSCHFDIGAHTYHNVQAGVKLWDKLKVRVGIDNVFDKQPPLLYQNNSLNGNTDERTFDTVGAYYWTSLSFDF
jgi:iron complex outermembrane recepter protein